MKRKLIMKDNLIIYIYDKNYFVWFKKLHYNKKLDVLLGFDSKGRFYFYKNIKMHLLNLGTDFYNYIMLDEFERNHKEIININGDSYINLLTEKNNSYLYKLLNKKVYKASF